LGRGKSPAQIISCNDKYGFDEFVRCLREFMKASEVRQSFLDFFQKVDHKIVHSAPVVPLDDPTLLFTNAGMNQFKDVFLGTGTRPYHRAADSQKCIRVSGKHNDLEECSEIHIDLGENYCDKKQLSGHVCGINSGCARYIELWNLVFIQYNRDEKGKMSLLPEKHVDTGLGLERAVAVLQGKKSNYQTDLFIPIIEKITELTGKHPDETILLPSFRVISDHIRALTFAITDGGLPSNEGRGYVLRRLLRRAARYGRNLNMHEPFIYKLVSTVIDIMSTFYPELEERAQHTTLVIKAEEERFNEVLDRGIEIFNNIISKVSKNRNKVIPGEEAFRLYDTYGFPLDLTQLMAREKGFDVDVTRFGKEMEEQRKRAKQGQKFSLKNINEWKEISQGTHSEFIGYETMNIHTEIRKISRDEESVTVLLSKTPFYSEAGGQIGDKGQIKGKGFCIRIDDTQRQGDMILHIGSFTQGSEVTNPTVEAIADRDLRLSTARNHTATHLLHQTLREVIGNHVSQAGSLVEPERLRFDFTHFKPMTMEQIDDVEWRVNDHIRRDHVVQNYITSFEKAKDEGAIALFGEKYDEQVRVIKIDNYSMELCGGTHLDRTGQIGYFRIVNEEGIAAGVRRIEALTGEKADHLLRREKTILKKVENLLQCRTEEVEDRLISLIEGKKYLEKHFKETQQATAISELDSILEQVQSIKGIQVVTSAVHVKTIDELRYLGDRLRERLKSGIGVLGAEMKDKVNFLCVVTDDLIQTKNINAVDIVREIGNKIQGGGGGKPHLAIAGGKDKTNFQQTLKHVPKIIKDYSP